ncbi:MAG TPA: hypothetical protein VGO93_29945 [Candidatus Xenobia bacterium]
MLREKESHKLVVGHHFTPAAHRPEAEAARLQGLTYQRLPRFLEYQAAENGPWFLFEYVAGFIVSCYQPDEARSEWISFWLFELLGSLEYLHRQKQWVGGFMPGDLIVNSTGLYLVDHGSVTRMYPENSAMGRSPDRRAFMAPEEQHSPRPTEQSDLFSAGAMAYWLLTGEPPPSDRPPHPSQLIQAHRKLLPIVAEVICGLVQTEKARRMTARQALDRIALEVPSRSGQMPPEPEITFQMTGFDTAKAVAAVAANLAKAKAEAAAATPETIVAGKARPELQSAIEAMPKPLPPPRPAPPPVPENEPPYAAALRLVRPFVLPALGVLLVVQILRVLFMPNVNSASEGKLMWVQTGPVSISDDGSDWQVANNIHAPSFLRSLGEETVLGFGHDGSVRLHSTRARLRLDRLAANNVSLTLLDGDASLQVPSDGTLLLGLPEGQAICPKGSLVDLSSSGAKTTVKVLAGNVSIRTWQGETREAPANTTWVSHKP